MLRTLLRILAVLVFVGAALTVQADTFTIDQVVVVRPTDSAPEPPTLLVFGAALGLTAWRIRRNGVRP